MRFGLALVWAALTGPVVAVLLEAPHAVWAAMLGYHAGCAAIAGSLRAHFGPRPRWAAWLAWAVGSAGLVFGVGCLAVPILLPPPALDAAREVLAGWGLDASRAPWILAYYVAVNPAVEEWFWRSALLGAPGPLGVHRRRWIAIAAFVPFHAVVLVSVFGSTGLIPMCLGILGASALWTWLQFRFGSTWAAYASHLGADAGVALLSIWFLWGA